MPRYVVERMFPDCWVIPAGREGSQRCLAVVERNADEGVNWVHSYVSEDREKTFCVYDAPSPEAIRKTAPRNDLPVDRITQVRVLDPYFYERRREAEARRVRIHRVRDAWIKAGASGTAGTVRGAVPLDPRREPFRPPSVLGAPCLDLAPELSRTVPDLESAG